MLYVAAVLLALKMPVVETIHREDIGLRDAGGYFMSGGVYGGKEDVYVLGKNHSAKTNFHRVNVSTGDHWAMKRFDRVVPIVYISFFDVNGKVNMFIYRKKGFLGDVFPDIKRRLLKEAYETGVWQHYRPEKIYVYYHCPYPHPETKPCKPIESVLALEENDITLNIERRPPDKIHEQPGEIEFPRPIKTDHNPQEFNVNPLEIEVGCFITPG